ncbi:GREB1-like protein isoform X2 [Clavelina lepadiformis]
MPASFMGSNHSLQKAAFEEALHQSIETSLRSSAVTPSRIFSSFLLNLRPSSSISSNSEQDVKPNIQELDGELNRQNCNQLDDLQKQQNAQSSANLLSSYHMSPTISSSKLYSTVKGGPPALLSAASLTPTGAFVNKQKSNVDGKHTGATTALPLMAQQQHLETRVEHLKHLQRMQVWQQMQQDRSKIHPLSRLPSRSDMSSTNQQPAPDIRSPTSHAISVGALPQNGLTSNGASQHPTRSSIDMPDRPQMMRTTKLPKGYCKAGKDIRLANIEQDASLIVPYPNEYVLLALQTTLNANDMHGIVVISLNLRSLPPPNSSSQAISVQCVGCGEKSLRTFLQLIDHIGLEPSADPANTCLNSSQLIGPHARFYLIRDPSHPRKLIRGPPVLWNKTAEERMQGNMSMPRLPVMSNTSSAATMFRGNAPNSLLSKAMHPAASRQPEPAQVSTLLPSPTRFGVRGQMHPHLTRTISGPAQEKMHETPKRQISGVSEGEVMEITDDPPPKRYMLSVADNIENIEIPQNLTSDLERKPVILLMYPLTALPRFIGDVANVIVTSHLAHCFREPSLEAKKKLEIFENYTLFNKFMLMATIQYLIAIGPHGCPSEEDFSFAVLRAKQNLASENPSTLKRLDSTEIMAFAKMAAATSNGLVEVHICKGSFASGIAMCLRKLSQATSAYQVVVHATNNLKEEINFHIIVTDKLKCRSIEEGRLSYSDRRLLISQDLLSMRLTELRAALSVPGLDVSNFSVTTSNCSSSFVQEQNGSIFSHCCSNLQKFGASIASRLSSKVQEIFLKDNNIDLVCFTSLRFIFLLPTSSALLSQTTQDISNSGILSKLYKTSLPVSALSSQVVVTMETSSTQRLMSICKQWEGSSTLLVLIQLDAHSSSNSQEAMNFLNSSVIRDSKNIVVIQCSSTPYSLLTDFTRVPLRNIVYGSAHENCDNATTSFYFGTTTTCSASFTTVYDPTYELDSKEFYLSFHDLHSSVIGCEVLIHQYSMSLLMCAAENDSVIPANLRKHTSALVLQVVRDLLASCRTRLGSVVIVRVASSILAARFYDMIKEMRDRLNLDNSFEILLHNDTDRPIALSTHFLQTLQERRNESTDWCPSSLRDLAGIPCIVVYEGNVVFSQPMPKTLQYIDMRLAFGESGPLYREKIEQEMSLAATLCCSDVSMKPVSRARTTQPSDDYDALRVVESEDESNSLGNIGQEPWPRLGKQSHYSSPKSSKDQNASFDFISLAMREADLAPSEKGKSCESDDKADHYAPVAILPKEVYDIINSTTPGKTNFHNLPPSSACTWKEPLFPPLAEQASCDTLANYYRTWTIPKETHPDYNNQQKTTHSNRILLVTPPPARPGQICCLFLQDLYSTLMKMIEVEVFDDLDDNVLVKDESFHIFIANSLSRGLSQICNSMPAHNLKEYICRTDSQRPQRKSTTKLCSTAHVLKIQPVKASANYGEVVEVSPAHFEYTMKFTPDSVEFKKEINLRIVVPRRSLNHCVLSRNGDGSTVLNSFLMKSKKHNGIKTPIISFVVHGIEEGLFNISRTMSNSSGEEEEHLHLIIVKACDAKQYTPVLAKQILVVLPAEFDHLGMGAMKFTAQALMQHMYELGSKNSAGDDAVWPFVLFMDDDVVSWSSRQVDCANGLPTNLGEWEESSLHQVMHAFETTVNGDIAALGFRPWGTNMTTNFVDNQSLYRGSHVSDACLESCIFINIELTKGIYYNHSRFNNEDIDWSIRVAAASLNVRQFENIAISTKVMPQKMFDFDKENQSLVVAADSDFEPLPCHPCLLLEKHFSSSAGAVFPQAKMDTSHPVLCVNCYISLGTEVVVEFTSCSDHGPSWTQNVDKEYGGLLLYCVDPQIISKFLEKFRFVEGATVCVVGSDRSSIRQTVVNLSLETLWHFRLTDEFQSANCASLDGTKIRPFFFLTGVKKA